MNIYHIYITKINVNVQSDQYIFLARQNKHVDRRKVTSELTKKTTHLASDEYTCTKLHTTITDTLHNDLVVALKSTGHAS